VLDRYLRTSCKERRLRGRDIGWGRGLPWLREYHFGRDLGWGFRRVLVGDDLLKRSHCTGGARRVVGVDGILPPTLAAKHMPYVVPQGTASRARRPCLGRIDIEVCRGGNHAKCFGGYGWAVIIGAGTLENASLVVLYF